MEISLQAETESYHFTDPQTATKWAPTWGYLKKKKNHLASKLTHLLYIQYCSGTSPSHVLTHVFPPFRIWRIFMPEALVMWTCNICTLSYSSPLGRCSSPKVCAMADSMQGICEAADASADFVHYNSLPGYLMHLLLGKNNWHTHFFKKRCDKFRIISLHVMFLVSTANKPVFERNPGSWSTISMLEIRKKPLTQGAHIWKYTHFLTVIDTILDTN